MNIQNDPTTISVLIDTLVPGKDNPLLYLVLCHIVYTKAHHHYTAGIISYDRTYRLDMIYQVSTIPPFDIISYTYKAPLRDVLT